MQPFSPPIACLESYPTVQTINIVNAALAGVHPQLSYPESSSVGIQLDDVNSTVTRGVYHSAIKLQYTSVVPSNVDVAIDVRTQCLHEFSPTDSDDNFVRTIV